MLPDLGLEFVAGFLSLFLNSDFQGGAELCLAFSKYAAEDME